MANSMALNLIAEVMGWEEGETSPANRRLRDTDRVGDVKFYGGRTFPYLLGCPLPTGHIA